MSLQKLLHNRVGVLTRNPINLMNGLIEIAALKQEGGQVNLGLSQALNRYRVDTWLRITDSEYETREQAEAAGYSFINNGESPNEGLRMEKYFQIMLHPKRHFRLYSNIADFLGISLSTLIMQQDHYQKIRGYNFHFERLSLEDTRSDWLGVSIQIKDRLLLPDATMAREIPKRETLKEMVFSPERLGQYS